MKRTTKTYIHPGVILKEEIEARNLSISQASLLLDIEIIDLTNISTGKRSITPSVALKIATVFGGSVGIWNKMQNSYDLWKSQNKK